MTLQVTDEQLNQVIQGAILQTLTPETREKLVAQAIAQLMDPKAGYANKSKLMQAFEDALYLTARTIFEKEVINNEGVRGMIESIIKEAVKQGIDERREKIVEYCAHQISSWISRDKY